MANIQPHRVGMAISAFLSLAIIGGGAYYFATRSKGRRKPPRAPGKTPNVVTNARIYTVDPLKPWADAFAIDANGVITAVGTTEEVLKKAPSPPKVLNAEGNFVMPGFHDPHLHVPEAGINQINCFMPPGKTLQMYATRAANCALRTESGWVRAVGASLRDFMSSKKRPLSVLDKAVPKRPTIILDDLGHIAWVNSAALRAANIGRRDPDPRGGIYQRDATGRLTGLLLENAQHRVRDAARDSPEVVLRGLLNAQKRLAEQGVTSISDAGGYWPQGFHEAFWAAEANKRMTVRANNAVYLYPDRKKTPQLAILRNLYEEKSANFSRIGVVKIYVDGILDISTAGLVKRYDDDSMDGYPKGFFYFKRTPLYEYALELHKIGYQLHFHAVGDGAVRRALDTIQFVANALGVNEVRARRHRLTHLYLVRQEEVSRFRELGVIADFQLSPYAISRKYELELRPQLGKTRAAGLLPVSVLADAGVNVTLSSDWDAEELNPLAAMMRMMTRRKFAVKELEKVIRMTTINGAYALHQNDTGSIKVGNQADFIILDRDLFKTRKTRIGNAKVLITAMKGRIVYNKTEADRRKI